MDNYFKFFVNDLTLTTAVSFSVPGSVTASASSGTDMLLPHIQRERCFNKKTYKSEKSVKHADAKRDKLHNLTAKILDKWLLKIRTSDGERKCQQAAE